MEKERRGNKKKVQLGEKCMEKQVKIYISVKEKRQKKILENWMKRQWNIKNRR